MVPRRGAQRRRPLLQLCRDLALTDEAVNLWPARLPPSASRTRTERWRIAARAIDHGRTETPTVEALPRFEPILLDLLRKVLQRLRRNPTTTGQPSRGLDPARASQWCRTPGRRCSAEWHSMRGQRYAAAIQYTSSTPGDVTGIDRRGRPEPGCRHGTTAVSQAPH